MDTSERRDAVVRMMRRRGFVSVAELADEGGVSRRTILRDLAALRDQGFRIDAEPGRGGGVRLDPTSVQLTTRLSAEEVFSLLLSVSVLRASQSLPFAGVADRGLARIEASLPPDRVKSLRELLARVLVGAPAGESFLSEIGEMDPDLLGVFELGFTRQRYIAFGYVDRSGARTVRRVEPQGIFVRTPVWYLIGYDPDRADFRHFRMDRIEGPVLLEGERFTVRHMDLILKTCPGAVPVGKGCPFVPTSFNDVHA